MLGSLVAGERFRMIVIYPIRRARLLCHMIVISFRKSMTLENYPIVTILSLTRTDSLESTIMYITTQCFVASASGSSNRRALLREEAICHHWCTQERDAGGRDWRYCSVIAVS